MTENQKCRLCCEIKPLDQFEIDRRVKNERTNRCKACKSNLQDKARLAFRHMRERAARAGIPMEITVDQIRTIYNAHDGKCIYCGATEEETGKSHHMDHITPLSRGGTNHISNLVIACASCNISKADKPLITFYFNRDRDVFSDESLSAVAWVIALTSEQPLKEVVNKMLEEHAEYVIEQNFKGLDKVASI
ncbi:HNH endonuclease [Bacillus gobiensis]|uniref:HNH endonuclease n=1 Tax=Bacillus gobiensis TaxID=1441095 RepID=UPI0006AD8953|nr:HNH endonuclease signature motif containing protein [Bacillus gobiensis]